MFEWLTRWAAKERQKNAERVFGPFVKGMSLATAFAEVAAKYTKGVEEGRIEYPAHRRALNSDRGSAISRWEDIRLETFARSHAFGEGSLIETASVPQQVKILDVLLSRSPFEGSAIQRNCAVEDSVSCFVLAYEYLGEIGSELCDELCDVEALRFAGHTIYGELQSDAARLRAQWLKYQRGDADLPRTIFELFVDDLNRKTKSLALSSVLGPEYERAFQTLVQKNSAGENPARVLQLFEVIKRAPNLDVALQELRKLGL